MAVATPKQAIKFAQSLIQRGMPTARSADDSVEEKERFARQVYEYVTRRCCEAPFMTLEKSTETSRTWSQQKIRVAEAIGKFLPPDVYDDLKKRANLNDVQSVMDLHTFKDFSSNIFSHELSDDKRLVDLIFMDEPGPTTSTLVIHYIRLTAKYSGRRALVFKDEYRQLTAEYRRIEFSALPTVLQELERRSRSSLADKMEKWIRGD